MVNFPCQRSGLLEIKNENIPWLTLKHFIATILFPWESMAKCLEVSGCLFFISYAAVVRLALFFFYFLWVDV